MYKPAYRIIITLSAPVDGSAWIFTALLKSFSLNLCVISASPLIFPETMKSLAVRYSLIAELVAPWTFRASDRYPWHRLLLLQIPLQVPASSYQHHPFPFHNMIIAYYSLFNYYLSTVFIRIHMAGKKASK